MKEENKLEESVELHELVAGMSDEDLDKMVGVIRRMLAKKKRTKPQSQP